MHVLPATPAGLHVALQVLRDGGVVAHPTETCYGFAADMTNPKAVERLFKIKQRPEHQPVSALLPDVDTAKQYVEWNEKADELAQKFLPGPLTLILPMRKDAPHALIHQLTNTPIHPSIGVRVSSHPFAQLLAKEYGKPISTTSANLHGQPNPYSVKDIQHQYEAAALKPDLVMDGGTLEQKPPSTIIDLTKDGQVLRAGEIGKK